MRGDKAGLRAIAASLGGGAEFCLGMALPAVVKDYERLPAILAGLHFVAFACLFLL